MATDIFICYRREGGDILAHLLYQHLKGMDYSVFLDVESLRAGEFNKALYQKIEECTDFLIVLPANALERCCMEDDWVRLEIEHALSCKKNIIPIMTRNFEFPVNLPLSLQGLPYYNGIRVSLDYFDAVINKLVKSFLKSTPNKNVSCFNSPGLKVLCYIVVIVPLLFDFFIQIMNIFINYEIVDTVSFVASLFSGFVGAAIVGLFAGILPSMIAFKNQQQFLAVYSLVICIIAGVDRGLLLAAPFSIAFTILILILAKKQKSSI